VKNRFQSLLIKCNLQRYTEAAEAAAAEAEAAEAAEAAGEGGLIIDGEEEEEEEEASSLLRGDAGAADEMARYASLVDGAHAAMTMMGHAWSAGEWRWAMSQVHSRMFRVEEPTEADASCRTRRIMVPFVDPLNHDSREDVWQCEWACKWNPAGSGDGTFVVGRCTLMTPSEP
jgi:hypothetical protein